MAVDIRRMNHEQLEELNRTGREWRERKLGQPMPDPAPARTLQNTLIKLPSYSRSSFHFYENNYVLGLNPTTLSPAAK
jgi:hypothetical protein